MKSEYLVFCSNCNKKLENNYSEWSKHNYNKTFDDYISTVCVEKEPIVNTEKVRVNPFIVAFIFIFGFLYIFLGLLNILDGADKDVRFYLIDDILVRGGGVLIAVSSIGVLLKNNLSRKALIIVLYISIIEFFIFIPSQLTFVEIALGISIGIIAYVPGIVYFSLPMTKRYFRTEK